MALRKEVTRGIYNKKAQSIISIFLVIVLIFGGIVAFDLYNRPYSAKSLQDQINNTETKINELQSQLTNPSMPKEQKTTITQQIALLNTQRTNLKEQFVNIGKKAESVEQPGWLSKIFSPFSAMVGYEKFSFLSLTNLVNILSVIIASILATIFIWLFREEGKATRAPFRAKLALFSILTLRLYWKYFLVIGIILIGVIAALLFTGAKPIILTIVLIFAVLGLALILIWFIHDKGLFVPWLIIFSIISVLYLLLGFLLTPLRILLFPLFSDYGLKMAMTYQEIVNPIAKALGREMVNYASYTSLLWEYIKLAIIKGFFTAIYAFVVVLIVYSPIAAKNYIVNKINAARNIQKEEKMKYEEGIELEGSEFLKKVGETAAE